MKCANCGGMIIDSDYVCPHCGEQLKGSNTGIIQTTYDDQTYLGEYHLQDEEMNTEEKTVLDSMEYHQRADINNQEEKTQMDFSRSQKDRIHQYDENNSGSYIKNAQYRSDQWTIGNSSNSDDYQQKFSPKSESYYTGGNQYSNSAANTAYRNTLPINEGKGRSSKPVFILLILVVLIVILAMAAFFFFTANRKPTMESMTYQDLIEDYELTGDETDVVKNAFHDRTRIEFEDFQKSRSGYKATAYVYTPEMEEIYEKTVNEKEIIDAIQRSADSDLDNRKEKVQWNQSGKELTKNSAITLQRTIDDQYYSVTEYLERMEQSDASETPQSTGNSNNAGNPVTPSNNQKNASSSQSSNSGNQNNSNDRITDTDDPMEDESYAPFYGVWCAGYKTEAEALSYIQSSGLSAYNPQVFITTQWSNLNKEKYYVVTAGVYGTKSEADHALSNVKSIVPDAYVKYSGNWIG